MIGVLAEAEAMGKRIEAVLRKCADKSSERPRFPMEDLFVITGEMEPEERGIREDARHETMAKCLGFLFDVTSRKPEVRPLQVLQKLFALVKAIRPDLIAHMSLEDIAILCGDKGKATVGARVKRVFNETMEAAGFKSPTASFQKPSELYAEAQLGNSNRSKKHKGKRR